MYGKPVNKGGNYIPRKPEGGGIKAVISGKGSYGQTNATVMKNTGGTGRPPGKGPRIKNYKGEKGGMSYAKPRGKMGRSRGY